ncbi:MAG: response regulator [Thermotogota bacterium]
MISQKDFLELIEAKEKYETFFRKAPLPFQSLDKDGRFLDVNELWLQIMGYEREEVIGHWFGDFLFDEKQRNEYSKNFALFKKQGFVQNIQFKMKKKDSSPIFVSFDGKIAYDDHGHFKQTYCIFRDITQEKKLQEEIEQINWLLTRDTEDLYKTSKRQSYGDLSTLNTNRTILDSVGKETLEKMAGETMDLLETSIAIYERNGDYAIGLFTSGWCQLLDNQSRKLCGDLSNQKALNCGKWICHESCWAHSKKAIETGKIVDSTCAGGIRLYIVPIFAGENVIGAFSIGYDNPPDDLGILQSLSKKFHTPLEELIEKKEAYRKRPPYIIEIAKKKIRMTAKLIGIIVQEKITEKKLRQSESMAREASQAKSVFLANMSHELRTPLNGIIGFSEILKTTPLDDEQKGFLDIVCASAKHLTEIIADILDFSRIEAGKLELSPKKTTLRKLIDDTCSIVRFRAETKGVSLNHSIERQVPQTVTVDGPRLRQILVNLLSNAVKFTDEGSVQLSVRLLERQQGKARLLFKVTDTGMGIKEKDRATIFDPFHQADMSTSKKAEGTGLGLAIVKDLLERMDSSLKLESGFGEGSSFYFELLLPCEEEQSDNLVEKKGSINRNKGSAFKNKKVLIVEDNPGNMKYFKTALVMFSKDLEIIEAEDGKKAYHLYRKHKPDLILMDIIMPEIDGYQATAMIRNQDQHIPIIAMTAKALKEDRDTYLVCGMNDYITKPVSLDQLFETLKKYLGEFE